MENTEALNFIKRIINESKKNNSDYKCVQFEIMSYLDVLYDEKQITKQQKCLLLSILDKMEKIMNGRITADEVFVEALSKKENSKYVPCDMYEYNKHNDPNYVKEKKKEEEKPKVKVKTREETTDYTGFNCEPGECGRNADFRRKLELERYFQSLKPKEGNGSCGRFW